MQSAWIPCPKIVKLEMYACSQWLETQCPLFFILHYQCLIYIIRVYNSSAVIFLRYYRINTVSTREQQMFFCDCEGSQ